MSIIKQISVFDGSSWGINDIGANAGNIDLIAPSSTVTTNLVGSSNLFTALNNILPSAQLTASRALVTDANKKLAVSATTATQLGYVHGVTSDIQTQIDTLNTNLTLRAINNPTVLTNSHNLNSIITPGFYKTENTLIPTNAPSTDAYNASIIVLKARNNDIFQIYMSTNKNRMYWRMTQTTGQAWTTWYMFTQSAVS